jgi:hypothetical protein
MTSSVFKGALLLACVEAYDKNKFAANGGFSDPLVVQTSEDSNGQESNENQIGTSNMSVDWMSYFDISKCELIDACKPCSFKELQKWPECQETGYRLIKKCREQSFGSVNEKEEDAGSTIVCQLRTQELEDEMKSVYGEGVTIPEGLLADGTGGSISLFSFTLIIGLVWTCMMHTLNKRKEQILNETYSKLSIFKK